MSSVQLTVADLHLHDKGTVLFDGVTFTVPAGKVYGLVGQNGSGKTTLLSVIAGLIQPDSGEIKTPLSTKIGFLRQDFTIPPGCSISDILLGQGATTFSQVKDSTPAEKILKEVKDDESGAHNDWERLEKIEALLKKFDLPGLNHPASQLSGGQQRRVFLVQTLLSEPDILLLDEPTNHLDLQTITYLTELLTSSNTTTIVISHDRRFLDEVCQGMLEVWNKKVFLHNGNYSTYLENRAARLANKAVEDERTDQFITRELQWVRAGVKARSTKNKGRLNRFYDVAASEKSPQLKTAQIQIPPASHLGNKIVEFREVSIFVGALGYTKNQLDIAPTQGAGVASGFAAQTKGGGEEPLATGIKLPNISDEEIPSQAKDGGRGSGEKHKGNLETTEFKKLLLENFSLRFEEGMKIGVIGNNGSGKTSLFSTLLSEALRQRPEAVAALLADSNHTKSTPSHLLHTGTVRIGLNTRFNIVDQKRERLNGSQTLLEFISEGAETLPFGNKFISTRAYLKSFLFRPDQIERHLTDFSGGEKARALLAKEFIRGGNFLLLDEPTNDLDLDSIRSLESALEDFSGCAFIISHDREFLNHTATHILSFDGEGKWTLSTGNYDRWIAEYGTSNSAPFAIDSSKYKPNKTDWHQQKQLQKQFRKLTSDIETLQAEISKLNSQTSDPEFYIKNGSEKSQKIYSKIHTLTQKLSTAETEWLELSEQIDEEANL